MHSVGIWKLKKGGDLLSRPAQSKMVHSAVLNLQKLQVTPSSLTSKKQPNQENIQHVTKMEVNEQFCDLDGKHSRKTDDDHCEREVVEEVVERVLQDSQSQRKALK